MPEKLTTKREETWMERVDWWDLGFRVATHVSVAIATGYLTSVGSDLYTQGKAKRLAHRKDSNVLLLEAEKAS